MCVCVGVCVRAPLARALPPSRLGSPRRAANMAASASDAALSETTSASPSEVEKKCTTWIGCALAPGCTLHAWHTGMCVVALDNDAPRQKREVKKFDAGAAESSRAAIKRAREEGRLPPVKKRAIEAIEPQEPKEPKAKRKKRKKADEEKKKAEEAAAAAEEAAKKAKAEQQRKLGTRGGTRSRGTSNLWDVEVAPQQAPVPVTVALSVGHGGHVELSLKTRPRPKPSKQLVALRDYLAKGNGDNAANDLISSVSCELAAKISAQKGIKDWGCICNGSVIKGGMELKCMRCSLYFHAKCERLDYTQAELEKMKTTGTFICTECDQKELLEAGYDPNVGRFIWQCKYCTKAFDGSEHWAADRHGARCAAQLNNRKWSCPCNGKVDKKAAATQCKNCSHWFHVGCKAQQTNWWEINKKKIKELCVSCENANKKAKAPDCELQPKRSAVTLGGAVLGAAAVLDSAAASSSASLSQRTASACGAPSTNAAEHPLAAMGHTETGTLTDKRITIRKSGLGEHSGLGLFAAVKIEMAKRSRPTTAPRCIRRRSQLASTRATSSACRTRAVPSLTESRLRTRFVQTQPIQILTVRASLRANGPGRVLRSALSGCTIGKGPWNAREATAMPLPQTNCCCCRCR